MIVLMADLHGTGGPARAILEKVRAERQDFTLVVLGDIVDCLVEEGAPQLEATEIRDAAFCEGGLLELLRHAELVVGNQEQRLAKVVGIPTGEHPMARVMTAPTELRIGEALMTHGHQFHWQDAGSRKLFPVPDFTNYRLVFHGHHHHQRLVRFPRGNSGHELVPWAHEQWIDLPTSFRWAVNVGPVFERTGWVEYDQNHNAVRFRQLEKG